jgi:hypothetical protein
LAAQRRWLRYALMAYGGVALACVGLAWTIGQSIQRSEPFQLALSLLERDAAVAQVLGTPLETGFATGSIELGGASGKADLSFRITGPKASGRAYVVAQKHANIWRLDHVTVEADGGRRLALAPAAVGTSVSAARAAAHGRISDYAQVLKPDELAALERQLEAHQTATGQAFGAVIMGSLSGASSDAFGEQLTRSWALGRKGSETGLLIILAVHERHAQIRVASGLSDAFRQGLVSGLIQDTLEPAFRNGQYGQALATTFDALARQQGQK